MRDVNFSDTTISLIMVSFFVILVINTCTSGTHNCHPNATCYSLTGSAFRCICNEEMNYFGNGTYCFGKYFVYHGVTVILIFFPIEYLATF